MPKITSIKQQKDKNRVNIYLDGKFGFGIDLENFVKFGLKVEQELTGEELKRIVSKSEHQKILDRLLNFATFRPRSNYEVVVWLRRKKIPEDMHNSLFETLKRLDLLNDERFAKWWVEQRSAFRPKGKKALKFELLTKGVDRRIIEKVINGSDLNEESVASSLLKKRKERWKRIDAKDRRQKMLEYLARQGLDWEVAQKAVKEYNMDGDDKNI